MRYAQIGQSGITASVLTLGAMGIGGGFRYPDADDEVSIKAIHAALDAGINFIDTAPVYGFGHSEEVIGRAIKGRRDKVVISTKCGMWWSDDEGTYRFTWDDHDVRRNLSSRTIRIELERSLRALGTDYIDVYYPHNPCMPPFITPVEETIDLLNQFKKEGKIRTIGVSNCDTAYAQQYLDRGDLSIIQRKFNIVENELKDEVLPYAREHGLSVHAYSPLQQGLLTGRFTRDYVVPEGDSRADSGKLWTQPSFGLVVDFVDALGRDIASDLGITLTELAIAYDLAHGAFPIVGIRKPHHVESVVGAADVRLSDDVIAEIDRRGGELRARIQQA